MHRTHFISGLPRSGSTLLAALLRQNPRVHAGMSGPLAGMVGTMLEEMSGRTEFSVFIDDCSAEVIFDTSRGWCTRMPMLARLFPEAKVIACVRDLPWIIDSIERLVQRNAFGPSSIFNYTAGGTVYTRANGIAAPDGLVGFAYDALKQACFGAQADRLLLVQYETLTTQPAKTLQAIYAFIGEPPFAHDFNHVEYDVAEFDRRAGTPGLHTVRGQVKAEPRNTLLPPDLFQRFANDAFWRDTKRLPQGLHII
jgi:sulfotransferase